MDKKQQEYFDFMMSKPSGKDNQYSFGETVVVVV